MTESAQILRLIGERDAAQLGKRRAEAQALPALFLLLGDPVDLTLTLSEEAAISEAIRGATEPTALPCPACCLTDGQPDLRKLFRLAEIGRTANRGQGVAFWLRAARDAVPSRGPGHEGAEAVEAAIMVRRARP